jgi:hypothetical protein
VVTVPDLRRYVPVILIALIGGGFLYLGWTTLNQASETSCSACGRAVHLAAHVEGVSAGESLTFCCAACALRTEGQGLPDLRVTQVFDYSSGESLDPEDAVTVVGSDLNLCMREHVLMDAQKEASELHFDRCSPSVFSFSSAAAAERFQAEHGGVIKRFIDLQDSFE